MKFVVEKYDDKNWLCVCEVVGIGIYIFRINFLSCVRGIAHNCMELRGIAQN